MSAANLKKAFAKKEKAILNNLEAQKLLSDAIFSVVGTSSERGFHICFHDDSCKGDSLSLWEIGQNPNTAIFITYGAGKYKISENILASQKTIDTANLIVKTL